MRNSKTLEFMNNLNEKINKDNIEINKAIANPNLGRNQDRIKQAGYDIQYDGDYIKNPKTGKGVWPKDYNRDEKKKIDFKGKLDSERPTMSKTNRDKWDQEENRIPKSAKIGFKNGGPVFNNDEVEYYSPNYRDTSKKSVSTNINTYKKAVKDRDEKTKNAAYYDKEAKRDEDKIKEIEKDKERHQEYANSARKEANWAENKRKELMDKVRARKTSTVKEGAEPIIKGLKKKLKESVDEDFVNNAYDLIGDYLYNETGRDEVSWGEIKDYIYNDVCDDELHDYNPSKETMEAIKQRLKNGGYKVLEEQEKAAIEKEIDKLKDKMKETPIKDLTGEEAHKIEKLKKKIKDETLTEARQEEILSKLPKKKINEADDNIPDITHIFEEYDWKFDITTKEQLGSDYYYHTLVKTVEEAEKFNYHSDYWGDADTYQEETVDVVSQFEPYINKNVKINFEDGWEVFQILGILIDKQYNSISHLKILVNELGQPDLDESEEVYSEQGEEQQLNEETVGEKITSPSGKFYVGDPCYVLSDDIYYGIWDDKYNFEDGIIDCGNGLAFLVHGTAYGDGSYQGTNGTEYGVDSGTLAVIPMDLVAKTDGVQFGTVETSNTAWLDYNDGTFDITLDNGSFSIITSEEEEEEEDGPWDPENYDNYEEDGDEDYYRPGDDE